MGQFEPANRGYFIPVLGGQVHRILHFIHFSSIDALNSILPIGCFRMYSLNNMDDIHEMGHTLKELKFIGDEDLYKEDKESIHCFSMCSGRVLKDNTKMHNLWKLHGRDGNGICFRFGFQNRENWLNYHLVTVDYLNNDDVNYPDWKKIIKSANINSDNLEIDRIIGCFSKNKIYSFEEEIRLVFDNRLDVRTENFFQGKMIYPIVLKDKLTNSKNISYYNLPLLQFGHNQDEFEIQYVQKVYEMPKVEIKEIILGYRFNKKDVETLSQKFDFNQKKIKLKLSPLKKFF